MQLPAPRTVRPGADEAPRTNPPGIVFGLFVPAGILDQQPHGQCQQNIYTKVRKHHQPPKAFYWRPDAREPISVAIRQLLISVYLSSKMMQTLNPR